jgi:transcriptional regulator with XRE-family HTH domain
MARSPWIRPSSLALFGSALRRRRESLGLTLDALAQATGVSKPYLSNIETARAPGPPSEEKLRLLAAALKLPEADLLTGADWLRTPPSIRRAVTAATSEEEIPRRADGTIDLDYLIPPAGKAPPQDLANEAQGTSQHVPAGNPGELPLRPVPLINRVPAGKAGEFTDLSYPAGVADQYVPVPDLPDAPTAAAFALRVVGDSMAPDYVEGEILIVAPSGVLQDGADCVVRLGELDHFATTFKRIYFVRESAAANADETAAPVAIRLMPLNPAYAERTVPLEQVTGVYPLLYRLLPAKARATPPPEPPRPTSFTTPLSLEHD